MDNGSVLVYYRDTDNIEFVIDAHLYSIGNIFVIEDKHALLSTSEDKSVRMVEFPNSYPAQEIRKELTNLNHTSIKKKIDNQDYNNNNNNTNKNDYEEDYISNENNYISNNNDREMNNEKYNNYNNINRNNKEQYTIMVSEPMNKSYQNIFSDDLDGWDEAIEELS